MTDETLGLIGLLCMGGAISIHFFQMFLRSLIKTIQKKMKDMEMEREDYRWVHGRKKR